VVPGTPATVNGIRRCNREYRDGTLRSEGTLRDGLPVGEFKEWHPNGVLAARKVFAEDGMTLLEDCAWDEHGRSTRTWRKGV
jgi:antitoxin component YwqK of YwqJK toxin-antitoxin module